MGNTIKLTTDLKGIPVRWFPASWTLQEMTMATLWVDHKPTEFLTKCGTSLFKLFKQVKEEGNLWPILRIGRPHLRP
ncbi:hypothetical protein RhiirA1_466364 [Rhizophagus irregularis]|uniref:Uncharacterized protein n=1 Tax=Rhizophagus irregularis TaxID=588596 RepID=A0A2N0RE66_9GLOM|nr:hypothetical protein RhiirA1_466364 [Rhizophagus irregularis]